MSKNILKIVIYSVLTLFFTRLIAMIYGHVEYYAFFYDWDNHHHCTWRLLPEWYLVAETDELVVIIISIIIILGLGIGNSLLYIKHLNKRKLLYISTIILYIILSLWNIWIEFAHLKNVNFFDSVYSPPYREYSLKLAIQDMVFWIEISIRTCFYILWQISLINLLKNINKLKTHK